MLRSNSHAHSTQINHTIASNSGAPGGAHTNILQAKTRKWEPSQYLSGTIWLTPYSMVWDWRVSRPGPTPFCWPSCSHLYFPLLFLFLDRLVVWAGVFGLIGCQSQSPDLALPIFFNNNNNNKVLHSYKDWITHCFWFHNWVKIKLS